MALSCRQQAHLPHLWPTLPLEKDHMIYACEQFCQWCPIAVKDLKYVCPALNRSSTGRQPVTDQLTTTLSPVSNSLGNGRLQATFVSMRSVILQRTRSLRFKVLGKGDVNISL